MIPFPEKKYSVIYADPPWNYAAGGKTRNVERHYRTMKPEDIYSLPVQDIAEDDCLLFLWATFPNLDVALADDKAVAEGIIPPKELNETTAILAPSVAIAENEPTTQPEEWIDAVATAYCPCEICCGKWALNRPDGIVYTASGAIAEEGVTIAADWSVYSPGTILYIEGIGERIVQDRGGAISGQKIDVFFNNYEDALHFGRQEVRIKVISDTER